MSSELQVMKFGGTSVGDAECIGRTAQIIAKTAKEKACVVVVSAMSGVTNTSDCGGEESGDGRGERGRAVDEALRAQHAAATEKLIKMAKVRNASGSKLDGVLGEAEGCAMGRRC